MDFKGQVRAALPCLVPLLPASPASRLCVPPQKLAEQLYIAIISVFGAAAFLLGYSLQSFNLMMAVFAAGVGLACLLTVPDW